jgi:hypothetical protein
VVDYALQDIFCDSILVTEASACFGMDKCVGIEADHFSICSNELSVTALKTEIEDWLSVEMSGWPQEWKQGEEPPRQEEQQRTKKTPMEDDTEWGGFRG